MSNINNEIIEGNKLIAEFMKQWKGVDCYMYGKDYYGFENLRYHLSWDWLMPVVEKIDSILFGETKIEGRWCEIQTPTTQPIRVRGVNKIDAVWLAVVEFIKFYNQK